MGVRLMVEVFDHWSDFGLTSGERSDLLVIAENANDKTRETFGSIHAPYILHRAGKSPASWRTTINKLIRKGALTYAVQNGREIRGHPGQTARYRMEHLCPEQQHDGLWGQCKRPEGPECVNSQMTQSEMGQPTDDASNGMGQLTDKEWVNPQMTPTPPTPQASKEETSETPSGPSDKPSSNEDREDVERVCAHLRQRIIDNGKPAHRVNITKDWRTAARLLMDRDGVTEDQVHRAIDWVQDHDFWHTNVRSMTKLREKYFELRDQAARDMKRRQPQEPAPGSMAARRTAAQCTEHALPLPCSSCRGDIRAGDTEVPQRLLAEHGPKVRWDLAEHLNHKGEAA